MEGMTCPCATQNPDKKCFCVILPKDVALLAELQLQRMGGKTLPEFLQDTVSAAVKPYAPVNTQAATLQAEIAAKQQQLADLDKNIARVENTSPVS